MGKRDLTEWGAEASWIALPLGERPWSRCLAQGKQLWVQKMFQSETQVALIVETVFYERRCPVHNQRNLNIKMGWNVYATSSVVDDSRLAPSTTPKTPENVEAVRAFLPITAMSYKNTWKRSWIICTYCITNFETWFETPSFIRWWWRTLVVKDSWTLSQRMLFCSWPLFAFIGLCQQTILFPKLFSNYFLFIFTFRFSVLLIE